MGRRAPSLWAEIPAWHFLPVTPGNELTRHLIALPSPARTTTPNQTVRRVGPWCTAGVDAHRPAQGQRLTPRLSSPRGPTCLQDPSCSVPHHPSPRPYSCSTPVPGSPPAGSLPPPHPPRTRPSDATTLASPGHLRLTVVSSPQPEATRQEWMERTGWSALRGIAGSNQKHEIRCKRR